MPLVSEVHQSDLVMESKSAQTDYLCEMKFSTGNFTITQDAEENIRHKIECALMTDYLFFQCQECHFAISLYATITPT